MQVFFSKRIIYSTARVYCSINSYVKRMYKICMRVLKLDFCHSQRKHVFIFSHECDCCGNLYFSRFETAPCYGKENIIHCLLKQSALKLIRVG